jgi:hypothetical protein
MSAVEATDVGVIANSRLTAAVGAVILGATAVEAFTLFDVRAMFALHAFVGMLLIPVALLKMSTTGYRFVKYYRRAPACVRRGPPHPILRIIGPFVVLSTIALLGTGALLLVVGPSGSDTIVTLHQASFIVWVSVTTVHVLGHIVETWRLNVDDLCAASSRSIPGVGVRRGLVLLSLIVGLGLGAASLGWNGAWADARRHDRPAVPSVAPG